MTRRTVSIVAGVALAGSVLASCSSPPPGQSETSALTTALHRLVAMPGGPPGAIALVRAGSQVRVLTAGTGNVGTGRAIATGDAFRIASVSKAFNGAVALALVGEGRLSLDDTIGKVLPSLPAAWSPVTLAQLLGHTSGMPDYVKSPAFADVLRADPQASMTPAQLLGFVAGEPLAFPPGSRYEYSDSDNIVVGLMVEAVTGVPYATALARVVTAPLRLSGTTLPADTKLPEPYVHGYDVEAGKAPADVSTALNPALAWASGGIVSTVSDLDAFVRAYVAGRLFGAAVRARQLTFVPGSSGPPGPGTNAAGLAVYRYATACGTVYGHTGNYPGYTTFAASTLDGTRSVVVVVNSQLNASPVTAAFTQLRQADELAVCAALRS